jgi:tetratricopeptide (TPR) repeat protein
MKEAVHDMIIRGKTHFDHGEFDPAKECFEMVLTQEPNLAEIHSKLGTIYHAEGKFQKASAAFRRALEINPNYTEAALNLVITLNENGRFEEAEEVFHNTAANVRTAALSLDPFIKGKLTGMHVGTGDAYNEIGWYDEAIHEYNMALKMRPDSIEVLMKIGLAHREKGDFNGAIRYFDQAKKLNPTYVPVLLHLGLTYYKQGKPDQAVAELQEARRINPANKEAATFLRLVDKGKGALG